ncbi:MAG: hypothetical protein A3F68_05560 [Acidobacteria bacterium RIFCSPLOWO2_12_FULL_54_10]|nr:MAG: hypothetical protein A3F68_05560 [Acidobacteria bacterium RIFCSPLOWO2_12_FULL_54_10]
MGYSTLQFDDQRLAVCLDRPGVEIDLGGIGKGWAVDRAAAVLRRRGIQQALVNAGTSSLYALGSPLGQVGWEVAVLHPREDDRFLAVTRLKDQSLSTSAGSETNFQIQDRSYSLIVDPRSGIPAVGLLSCTVLAPTATESDALSTATFVLGLDETEELVRRLGLAAMIVGTGRDLQDREGKRVVRRISPEGAGENTFWTILDSETSEKGKH